MEEQVGSSASSDNQHSRDYGNKYKDRQKDRDQGEVVHDRIYVGGLGHHIYDRDLFHFFSEFGAVRHVVVISDGGYSKGYGFVTFTCRESVRRLLEGGEEGENLVLKGRRLNIGAARQRFGQGQGYGQNLSGRSQEEAWARHVDKHCQANGSVSAGEDPSKTTPENEIPAADNLPVNIYKPVGSHPSSSDPTTYSYEASVQDPCCSEVQGNIPFYPYPTSYPIYCPQYLCHEYPQYAAYPPAPPATDVTWCPNCPNTIPVSQDMCTSTTFPTSNPIYPLTYSTSVDGALPYQYPMVTPTDQLPSSGHYWPQTPTYPVLYDYGQPTMVQYSYNQLVAGYQHCPSDVTIAAEYQNNTTSSYPDTSGCTEAPMLADSGYQDTTGGFQDTSNGNQEQDNTGCQPTATDRQQEHSPGGNDQDSRYCSKNAGNLINKAAPSSNIPLKSGHQKPLPNVDKEQQEFTKLKPADDKWEAARNSAVDPPGNSRSGSGRDSRVYPSPYKSFAPFTGNPPAPRHFPFLGPRPYYPDMGQRGRGRIWRNGGSQGANHGRSSQKKRQKKRAACSEEGQEDGGVGLSGNQPDILQGPLEKLVIK